MKIAYVFAYFGDGGTEDHATVLAKKAIESGNEPIFVISKYSDKAIEKLRDYKVIILPMDSSYNPFLVIKSVVGLKKIIKSESVDLVHTHMPREQSLAIAVKMIGGKFKLVRTFHRLDHFTWKIKPFMPLFLKYTDRVIAISDLMTRLLDENGWKGSYTVVKNGVRKVDAPKHDNAFGFIGRLSKEKGILQFIKSNVKLLQENRLVIAGQGPDYEEIRDFSKENNLKVELMGSVLEKSDFYKKASVLILPSSHEVLALVVLEAYSCGMPALAFDIAPNIELIKDENGALIKAYDYKKMGDEALKILHKAESYKKTNIELYESKYSDDIMWSNTYKLYKSLFSK